MGSSSHLSTQADIISSANTIMFLRGVLHLITFSRMFGTPYNLAPWEAAGQPPIPSTLQPSSVHSDALQANNSNRAGFRVDRKELKINIISSDLCG